MTADERGELEAALEALRQAEERFRLAFEHAPIGVALVAPDGTWLQVNEAFCRLVGRSREELLARTFHDITHPDDLDLDVAHAQQVLDGRLASYQLDKRYIRADGSEVWVALSVALVRDRDGEPSYFISQVVDISDRRRREAELQRLADHDPLTGLYNRRGFCEALERERLLAARHGTPAALLMLDLDDFKLVNDTFGHARGDALLQEVASRLSARCRRSDVAGRLGGDEFAVLLTHASEPQARHVAAALKADLAGIALRDGPAIRASVGFATVRGDQTSDELLAAADRAMYQDKRPSADGEPPAAARAVRDGAALG